MGFLCARAWLSIFIVDKVTDSNMLYNAGFIIFKEISAGNTFVLAEGASSNLSEIWLKTALNVFKILYKLVP